MVSEMTYDNIELTFVGQTRRPVSYTRSITFRLDGKEYSGLLFYDEVEGYDWDGDELPYYHGSWLGLLEELDALTCDQPECFGCEQRKAR